MAADAVNAQQAASSEKTKPLVEKQSNCLGCGKPIKKIKRYYRNGKFYCNKRCWRKALDKSKEEAKQ